MGAVDWCAEAVSWTRFLRDQGFRLTVGDDLRIATLVERLKEESVAIADVQTAARWFSPVVCRTADEQNRLPELMGAWERLRAPGTDRTPLAAPVAAAAHEVTHERKASRRRSRWLVLAAIALITIAGTIALLSTSPSSVAPPPDTTGPGQTTRTEAMAWREIQDRVLVGAFALTPFALVVLVRWRRREAGAALMRGLTPRDAPATALEINVVELDLFRPAAMGGTVADLRRHRLVPEDRIDGPRSVAATVAAGGHVQLVQALRPALPEHLLLVDLAGADDILGTLAELIAARLRDGQVKVERFDYQGDPRRLRRMSEQGVPVGPVHLETLRGLCPDHRLLVLSDATSFSEPTGERMRTWVDQLRAWSDVALVTPLPAAQWGPRERALIRLGFRVVEATPRGIGSLARQFRTELPQERGTPGGAMPRRFDRLFAADAYRWLGDRSPAPPEIADLVGEIKDVLGGRAFLYFAGLAVFPTVHPKLTMALGRVLSDPQRQPLLTEESLALLSRMPWLRSGRIPDWLRLALVRDLDSRPEEADRVRAAWSALLEPHAKGAATTLPIEVVRSVEPGLPALVSGLLKRGKPHREAILLAFLNGEALPELAMELPQRLAEMMRSRPAWIDWVVLLLGVGTAVLAASFMTTLGRALEMAQAAILPPGLGAFLADALPRAGLALGMLALALWYLRLLAERLSARTVSAPLQGIQHAMSIQAAVGSLVAFLGSGLLAQVDATLVGRVLLAALLVLCCWERNDKGALCWVPVLVLLNLRVFLGESSTLQAYPLMVPLVVWLATRHRWPALEQMFWYTAPALVVGLPLAQGVRLDSSGGELLGLVLLARFLSDDGFRHRCLDAGRINWREISVLLLPLGVGASLNSEAGILVVWDPTLPFLLILFLLGLTLTRPRSFLIGLSCLAATLVLTNLNDWPVSWTQGFPSPQLRWPSELLSALAVFACGRLLYLDRVVRRRFLTPIMMLLLVAAFAGTGVRLEISSFSGMHTISSAVFLGWVLLVAGATAALVLSRPRLWVWLGIAVAARLSVTFAGNLILEGSLWPGGAGLGSRDVGFLSIANPTLTSMTYILSSVVCAWVVHRIHTPAQVGKIEPVPLSMAKAA